jgi:hypothetical protein
MSDEHRMRAKALFTKPIESNACHVSVFAQHIAIQLWSPEDGHLNLAAALDGGNGLLEGPDYYRVADRMIQNMRKAGLIAFDRVGRKTQWHWKEKADGA